MRRRTIRVGADTGDVLEYFDTGGDGPVVVFLHGVLMNEALWEPTIKGLPSSWRCLVPVLPLGAHRHPRRMAGQGLRGLAELVAEFLAELELRQVMVVGNDTGGAVAQLLIAMRPDRVAAVVLISCDAFDNFPPGVPGRTMALAARLPGALPVAVASLRWRLLRRLPLTFGRMVGGRAGDHAIDRWVGAYLADREVRADLRRFLRELDRGELLAAAAELSGFERPALIVWASQDQGMPPRARPTTRGAPPCGGARLGLRQRHPRPPRPGGSPRGPAPRLRPCTMRLHRSRPRRDRGRNRSSHGSCRARGAVNLVAAAADSLAV